MSVYFKKIQLTKRTNEHDHSLSYFHSNLSEQLLYNTNRYVQFFLNVPNNGLELYLQIHVADRSIVSLFLGQVWGGSIEALPQVYGIATLVPRPPS